MGGFAKSEAKPIAVDGLLLPLITLFVLFVAKGTTGERSMRGRCALRACVTGGGLSMKQARLSAASAMAVVAVPGQKKPIPHRRRLASADLRGRAT